MGLAAGELASTTVVTASSSDRDTRRAVAECLRMLKGFEPNLVWVFAGDGHSLSQVMSAFSGRFPASLMSGASTAGEFTERGFTRGGLAVFAIHSDELLASSRLVSDLSTKSASVACEPFKDLSRRAAQLGMSRSTSIVLSDGLSSQGESFVEAVRKSTRPFQQVVGGAAGDSGRFKATQVGNGASTTETGASVTHIFSAHPFGVGLGQGLSPATPKLTVTKSVGNRVFELDGRPAFEVYQDFARTKGVKLNEANASKFFIHNELGVYFFEELRYARAPLFLLSDGSIDCAANVAEGASVCILNGEPAPMLSAARGAALEAKAGLNGNTAAGLLVFDCVCRGEILGDRFQDEVTAIRNVFGDVPVAGFLTYGEIARYGGKLQGWHNATAVVMAIPA